MSQLTLNEEDLLLLDDVLSKAATVYRRNARKKILAHTKERFRNMLQNTYLLQDRVRRKLENEYPQRSYEEQFRILDGERGEMD